MKKPPQSSGLCVHDTLVLVEAFDSDSAFGTFFGFFFVAKDSHPSDFIFEGAFTFSDEP